MPSISGGALRHLRVTEWARWLVIGFHALDVGRGVATRSHPRGSRPMERFPCPRSRAGRCDLIIFGIWFVSTRFHALDLGRGVATPNPTRATQSSRTGFHALDLGRGVATAVLMAGLFGLAFPCPRSRAGRCDIRPDQFRRFLARVFT